MPLFVPGGAFDFHRVQTNVTGQPTNTVGSIITPVVGSKGNWAQVITALDNDTYGLMIQFHSANTSAANRSYVVDIGVGDVGVERVIIPDLIASNASLINSSDGIWYYFPIFIPGGARVVARAQGSVVTTLRVNMQALMRPGNPAMIKSAGRVEEMGLTGVVGTAVTAGTTVEGAWTLIGTTTQFNWWWQWGIQVPVADATHVGIGGYVDLAWGNVTDKIVICQDQPFRTTAAEEMSKPIAIFGCEHAVPAGSNIYARIQLGGAGDTYEIAVYGAG